MLSSFLLLRQTDIDEDQSVVAPQRQFQEKQILWLEKFHGFQFLLVSSYQRQVSSSLTSKVNCSRVS